MAQKHSQAAHSGYHTQQVRDVVGSDHLRGDGMDNPIFTNVEAQAVFGVANGLCTDSGVRHHRGRPHILA